jgi:hypothetical protein
MHSIDAAVLLGIDALNKRNIQNMKKTKERVPSPLNLHFTFSFHAEITQHWHCIIFGKHEIE